MQVISTRLMITFVVVLVLLALVAMRVTMNHQNSVSAQVVNAHQTSVNEVNAKLNEVERMLNADRAARAELVEGCKELLREAGVQLGGRLEGLLVQQEMRLIRNLEMNGAARSQVVSDQQVIQPDAQQTITPESHTAKRR